MPFNWDRLEKAIVEAAIETTPKIPDDAVTANIVALKYKMNEKWARYHLNRLVYDGVMEKTKGIYNWGFYYRFKGNKQKIFNWLKFEKLVNPVTIWKPPANSITAEDYATKFNIKPNSAYGKLNNLWQMGKITKVQSPGSHRKSYFILSKS